MKKLAKELEFVSVYDKEQKMMVSVPPLRQ
jgi:hypothetical protein